jgi:hypothetical protein
MGIDALTLDERKLLLLSVGTHRGQRPLTPVEVSAIFKKVMDSGGSLQECAKAASLQGTTIVTRFLRLQQLPQSVAHLVDWGSGAGTLGFSVAAEIARLADLSDKEAVANAVLSHKLSGSEVRQVVQIRKRSKRPVDECIDEVLKLRPKIERRYVYVGAITDSRLRARLTGMTQHERDAALGNVIRSVLDGKAPSLAKLGVDRFTLVGAKDVGEVFSTDRDLVERRTNDALVGELL